mmetsp:Transcript_16355/g.39139  ORF Transcript_16355/g.39139 Transcript_16355/m.39139 type:complete len:252 (-) Transcript_16355:1197-1952(-)
MIYGLSHQDAIFGQQALDGGHSVLERYGIGSQTNFCRQACEGREVTHHAGAIIWRTDNNVREDVAIAVDHGHPSGVAMGSVTVLTRRNALRTPAKVATSIIDALGAGSVSGGNTFHINGKQRRLVFGRRDNRFVLKNFLGYSLGGAREFRTILIILRLLGQLYGLRLVWVEHSLVSYVGARGLAGGSGILGVGRWGCRASSRSDAADAICSSPTAACAGSARIIVVLLLPRMIVVAIVHNIVPSSTLIAAP